MRNFGIFIFIFALAGCASPQPSQTTKKSTPTQRECLTFLNFGKGVVSDYRVIERAITVSELVSPFPLCGPIKTSREDNALSSTTYVFDMHGRVIEHNECKGGSSFAKWDAKNTRSHFTYGMSGRIEEVRRSICLTGALKGRQKIVWAGEYSATSYIYHEDGSLDPRPFSEWRYDPHNRVLEKTIPNFITRAELLDNGLPILFESLTKRSGTERWWVRPGSSHDVWRIDYEGGGNNPKPQFSYKVTRRDYFGNATLTKEYVLIEKFGIVSEEFYGDIRKKYSYFK